MIAHWIDTRRFLLCVFFLLAGTLTNAADSSLYRTLKRTPQADVKTSDRIALVIGNSRYINGPLRNPENDAQDVADILAKKLGFDVILLNNQNLTGMIKAVREFEAQLKPGGTALLFYAGHGLQHAGINYMVPVDADINHEDDIKRLALPLTDVINSMEKRGKGINVIFLDACRNNPFAQSTRSSGGGWSSMQSAINLGTQIVYATKPGSVASDGTGRNGVFTSALLKHLPEKGLSISDMIGRVTESVARETQQRQIVWQEGSLTGSFQFVPGIAVQAMVTPFEPIPFDRTPFQDSFSDRTRGPLMLPLNRGQFSMGSIDGANDEQPVHNVAIQTPFALSRNEISNAEFRRFVDATHYRTVAEELGACVQGEKIMDGFNWRNPGWSIRDDHPVVCVTQNDANAYVQWLQKQSGHHYRLPSEAEWEYAARAGSVLRFSISDSDEKICEWANGNESRYDSGRCRDAHKNIAPVATLKANAWGFHDMLGNVWELTQDCYAIDYQQTPRDGSAHVGKSCDAVVARGGSYLNSTAGLRVSVRARGAIDAPATHIGFRIARDL